MPDTALSAPRLAWMIGEWLIGCGGGAVGWICRRGGRVGVRGGQPVLALGGRTLLWNVGGWPEQAARRGGAVAVLVEMSAAAVKLAGAAMALAVMHRVGVPAVRRLLVLLTAAASAVLVLYGGLLVSTGTLVLAGVINPAGPVDRTALRWHVFVWDAWFLLWGLLLGLTAVGYRRTSNQPQST